MLAVTVGLGVGSLVVRAVVVGESVGAPVDSTGELVGSLVTGESVGAVVDSIGELVGSSVGINGDPVGCCTGDSEGAEVTLVDILH